MSNVLHVRNHKRLLSFRLRTLNITEMNRLKGTNFKPPLLETRSQRRPSNPLWPAFSLQSVSILSRSAADCRQNGRFSHKSLSDLSSELTCLF
ncbi:hypothetical protein J6590_039112 [Homalodisca vitripennis]|nr:hypothetical protein J6590_039112 [Homalodisca vitripennis]